MTHHEDADAEAEADFKVGQSVVCDIRGLGKVMSVTSDSAIYPVRVQFDSIIGGRQTGYTREGRYYRGEATPDLDLHHVLPDVAEPDVVEPVISTLECTVSSSKNPREYKVGQSVICGLRGLGKVMSVTGNAALYPIKVQFDSIIGGLQEYTVKGEFYCNEPTPDLDLHHVLPDVVEPDVVEPDVAEPDVAEPVISTLECTISSSKNRRVYKVGQGVVCDVHGPGRVTTVAGACTSYPLEVQFDSVDDIIEYTMLGRYYWDKITPELDLHQGIPDEVDPVASNIPDVVEPVTLSIAALEESVQKMTEAHQRVEAQLKTLTTLTEQIVSACEKASTKKPVKSFNEFYASQLREGLAPDRRVSKADDTPDFRLGGQVSSKVLGTGQVIEVLGSGSNQNLLVEFPREAGVKRSYMFSGTGQYCNVLTSDYDIKPIDRRKS